MSSKKTSRRITEETKAESDKLKVIWKKNNPGLTQVEFGEKYDIGSQGAVYQFLNGLVPISMKAAIGFAEGLRCQISDFSPRLAKEAESIGNAVSIDDSDNVAHVKMLAVEVSAGKGKKGTDVVEEEGELYFKRSFLGKAGVSPANAAVVHVAGSSMEPTINDGAVILINRADTTPRQGFVYAFVHGEMLHVKRFVKEGECWIARSDNPDKVGNPDIVIDGKEHCRILGRAIWVGMKL